MPIKSTRNAGGLLPKKGVVWLAVYLFVDISTSAESEVRGAEILQRSVSEGNRTHHSGAILATFPCQGFQ